MKQVHHHRIDKWHHHLTGVVQQLVDSITHSEHI